MTNKALYTQTEAATYLGVKVRWLREEATVVPRQLPGHGEKGRPLIRYHKDDLDEWIRKQHEQQKGRRRA
jgi:Helix-turn-helix domain